MRKLIITILAGFLLISAVACGNQAEDLQTGFENSIFIGDSITYGFVVNEILPEDRVIGGAGTTAGFAYDDIEELAEMKVDRVFVMLGSDDLYMPVDDPKELFRNDMTKLINRIKEKLSESEIYLQSVTPVTQEALEEEPRYANIGDYNEILKELADELSVNYVDIGSIVNDNPDLFAEDGIHLKKDFYPLWLKKLAQSM